VSDRSEGKGKILNGKTGWQRLFARDYSLMIGLGVLTFLSRVPFRSQILYHWDSVNFANAMREFDMLQEHPQPPGYIVYVWLCRLVNLLFHDANATMVWISIVASSLAVVVLYLLGRDIWNRRVGLMTALFLAFSPLFWFYGEIALPHTLDTLLALLSIWLLYRVRQGEKQFLWPAVFALAIAGGVRQQTLVFLLPLALYAVWRVGWRRLAMAGLLGSAVCLTWFIPLAVSCGGIGAYLEKMGSYSARFQGDTSILMGAGWSGVVYNVRKLTIYTAYGASVVLMLLGFYGTARLARRRWPRRWDRILFLGLWLVPALLFYSLIHMGQQGLVFVFLPVLLLLGAVGLDHMLTTRRCWMAATALVIAVGAAIFCLAPEYPMGSGTQRLLTRETLACSDRYYAARFTAIRENFEPESTLILAANWDHVEYYLPEYAVLAFKDQGNQTLQSWEETIVTPDALGLRPDSNECISAIVFDSRMAFFNQSSSLTRELPMEHNEVLEHLCLTKGQLLHFGKGFFGVLEETE